MYISLDKTCHELGKTIKRSYSELVYSNNLAKESNCQSLHRMHQPSRLVVKLRPCLNRRVLHQNKNNGTDRSEIWE